MGILVLEDNKILVVGGLKNIAFIFDIISSSLNYVSAPELSRSFFAIAFIGNCPAIIGGLLTTTTKITNSVEIFNEGK